MGYDPSLTGPDKSFTAVQGNFSKQYAQNLFDFENHELLCKIRYAHFCLNIYDKMYVALLEENCSLPTVFHGIILLKHKVIREKRFDLCTENKL